MIGVGEEFPHTALNGVVGINPDKVIKIPLLFNHFRSVYRLLKDCISLPFYKKNYAKGGTNV